MKWISLFLITLSIPIRAENSAACEDLGLRLEKFLSSRQITVSSAKWVWKELNDFHTYFLEAMALDPAKVPLEETPIDLVPEQLNLALHHRLDALVESRHIVDRLDLSKEFDAYVGLVEHLLEQRNQGLYTRARRIVKRGPLHEIYNRLVNQMQEKGSRHTELKVSWIQDASPEFVNEMRRLSQNLQSQSVRSPASVEMTKVQFERIRIFLMILIPIVFVTGLSAGTLWSRRKRRSEWTRDKSSEPRL